VDKCFSDIIFGIVDIFFGDIFEQINLFVTSQLELLIGQSQISEILDLPRYISFWTLLFQYRFTLFGQFFDFFLYSLTSAISAINSRLHAITVFDRSLIAQRRLLPEAIGRLDYICHHV
jgi:hypothetical protein